MNYLKFITNAYELDTLKDLKEAGADAVVLSDSFYSARGAYIINISQFSEYRNVCAKLGLACYAFVNRLFIEEELPKLEEHLRYLKDIDIDGIYFSDEAVLQIAKQLHIADKLIYNPDTLITNAMDAQYYIDEDIKMVTLSKEITFDEICAIAQKCDGKRLEVIIHGRLLMMHSKRHLLSNYLQFIHSDYDPKNIRTIYMMEETRDEHMPIMEDDLGTHAFSGFTLASFLEIKQFESYGIQNVRIEGMFHDAAYTIEALRYYQDILQGNVCAEDVMNAYQQLYPNDHVTSGFYKKKTSKTK